MTNRDLSTLLSAYVPQNISRLDKYKIIYRPFITPFAELLNIIPEKSKVFDIGCGNGALLNLIYKTRNAEKLGGVEISSKLVDTTKKLLRNAIADDNYFNSNIDVQQYDGINLPQLTAYDFVLLVDVIHHIPKKQLTAFLSTLKKNMRPGTVLICKDIDAGKPVLVLFNKLHDFAVSQEIGNEISMQQASQELTAAGFNVVSATYKRMLWYPHYTLISKVV
jgi:2-polyprenyl-3-methyl-5-hydroxy-6-metoxy-1,4-benzoquinol methylase